MYNSPHFAVDDRAQLLELMRSHPLGCLIAQGPQGLNANHLPFEVRESEDGQLQLWAHVARANPLWQQLGDGMPVLIVFRAEESYISPNWYPSKQATHEQVPTWNYRVVHAHGTLRIRDDEKFVRGVVGLLTRRHELRLGQRGEHQPWKMSDAPQDYLQKMLGAIVGLEVDVSRLEGKFKLSQNKSAADQKAVADSLLAAGFTDMGRRMQEQQAPESRD